MCDILVIGARGIPDVQGGLEKHAEMLFPQFAAAGYSVTLLGLSGHIDRPSYKGVRLVALPSVSVFKTDKVLYHFIALIYAVASRPKLVHLQGLNAALLLRLYRLFGLKVVIRFSSSDYEYPKWGRFERWVLRHCARQLPLADHVVTNARHYERRLAGEFAVKAVTVVPNGVEMLAEADDPDAVMSAYGLAGRTFVLAVGRVTPEKDYLTLVQAIERAGAADVALAIAGGAGDEAYHRALTALASDRIRFLGQVARPALAALYRRCSLYVCSSIYEGQSNAVLEALAFGKPIIASDIPANRELLLNEDCYFPAGDTDALARRLDRALADPGAFVCRDAQFVRWDEVYRMTASVYRAAAPTLAGPCASRSAI